MRRPGTSAWVAACLFLIVLPLAPGLASDFARSLLTQMEIAAVFALSYQLLLGQTGLLSFGHAVYFGLGGYAAIHLLRAVNGGLALPVALVPLGASLNFSSVTALLSRVVGENERGLYMGVQQTYGGIARVIYPLIAGIASDHLGEAAPFWISGGFVLSTIVMGSRLGTYSSRTSEFEVVALAKEATAEVRAAE